MIISMMSMLHARHFGAYWLVMMTPFVLLSACSDDRQGSESNFEYVHLENYEPGMNMPYTPAMKVRSGSIVFLAGVTAAPVYHSHPHIASEFDDIPTDSAGQAEMAMENLLAVLEAAGGELTDIVQLNRFIVDIDRNQDGINSVAARYLGDHRPASTTVEVTRLATDPRLVLELEAIAVVPE